MRSGSRSRRVPWSGRAALLLVLLGSALLAVAGWPPPAPARAQTGAAALRYVLVPERSEARYRVREQLVGLRFPNDAVGATSAVEGRITLDGRGRVVPAESRFTVDLRTLRSDEPRRDNYLRRNTLETDRYPSLVFVPTELRGLKTPPAAGPAGFQLAGDLTVRDVTRRVTWEVKGTFAGDEATVKARTSPRFEELGLRVPRVSVVLSVEDAIHLEADLVLRRSP